MKKFLKLLCITLCAAFVFPLITACSGEPLEYNDNVLPAAEVGVEYSESIAEAEADGDAAITYALKNGSSLPAGLSLSSDGNIYGIPAERSASKITFAVIASAEGYKSAEARFSIPSIEKGTLEYSASLPRAAINKPYLGSLAVTGAGSAVTYTLASGEIPTGLNFNNGVITGTPTVLNEEKTFTVTASATDSTSVTGVFTLKVILPWLEYSGFEIEKARQDVEYGETVAAAKAETDVNITYALKDGSSLPAGLTMDSEGFISGNPTVAGPAIPFTVVASAAGYSPGEATFKIVVRKPNDVVGEGTIIYSSIPFEPGYLNEAYHIKEVDIRKGMAANGATVTYALKDGSSLPNGLVWQSGRIRPGTGSNSILTQLGEHSFIVVARAEGCPDVEVTFNFTVLPERLIYAGGQIDMATVGDGYMYSVATAATRTGVSAGISYTLKGSIPAGLSLSANGQVTGTPTKSAKDAMFTVTASLDGYTSVEASFSIRVQEQITTVNNGVFEAEYIDLTGITGEGWSGSAFEEAMIQSESPYAGNDHYIGYTFGANTYTFNFTSSAAVTCARMLVSLATEAGNKMITPAAFEIRVNNVTVPYTSFALKGETGKMGAFEDYNVTTNGLSLFAGDNKIELIIHENGLMDGRTFGPGMDCIKIQNFGSSVLTWRPCTYNLS